MKFLSEIQEKLYRGKMKQRKIHKQQVKCHNK